MEFAKVCCFFILTIVMAIHAAPTNPVYDGHDDQYEPRDYRFNYQVKDDPTSNFQTRQENKVGNTITGQYTVMEPNGQLRVVSYIADDFGFRADVRHHSFNEKKY